MTHEQLQHTAQVLKHLNEATDHVVNLLIAEGRNKDHFDYNLTLQGIEIVYEGLPIMRLTYQAPKDARYEDKTDTWHYDIKLHLEHLR